MTEFEVPVTVPSEDVAVSLPAETVTLPERTITVSTPERSLTAVVDVDLKRLRTVLLLAGWSPDRVDIGQAIATAESGGRDAAGVQHAFSDAVGDLTVADPRYGPSIGLFQIRSLRHPLSWWNTPDVWRFAWALRQPIYNAQAAWAISKSGADFTPWSVFRSESYKQWLGGDPVIRVGHSRAADWSD